MAEYIPSLLGLSLEEYTPLLAMAVASDLNVIRVLLVNGDSRSVRLDENTDVAVSITVRILLFHSLYRT